MVSVQNVSINEYIYPTENTTCRLCMKKYEENEFEDLFNFFGAENETIAQHVTKFANIPIHKDDCFSNVICKNCLRKLRKIEHFKMVIFDCNDLLQDLYNSYNEAKKQNGSESNAAPSIMIMYVPKKTDEVTIKKEIEEEEETAITIEDDNNDNNKNVSVDEDFKIDIVEHDLAEQPPQIVIKHNETDEIQIKLEDTVDGCDNAVDSNDSDDGGDNKMEIVDESHEPNSNTKIYNIILNSAQPNATKKRMETHSMDRGQECRLCNKTFSTSRGYKAHMNNHNGDLEFKCELCPKAYTTYRSLQNHFDSAHNNVKPFSCEICGKEFGRRTNWYAHKKVHSQERAFSCTLCERDFRRSDHLNKHMRTIHAITK